MSPSSKAKRAEKRRNEQKEEMFRRAIERHAKKQKKAEKKKIKKAKGEKISIPSEVRVCLEDVIKKVVEEDKKSKAELRREAQPARSPLPPIPERLDGQDTYNGLDGKERKKAWLAINRVMWCVGREANVIKKDVPYGDWIRAKTPAMEAFQRSQIDKFLSKRYVMVLAVFGNEQESQYSLEPIQKDAPDSTIETGYWEIESFVSMFTVGQECGYRLKFKRFEDFYDIMSVDIPNHEMKEEFRAKYLADRKNRRVRRSIQQKRIKRAVQREQDPDEPDCVVLSEEEETKARNECESNLE